MRASRRSSGWAIPRYELGTVRVGVTGTAGTDPDGAAYWYPGGGGPVNG